MVTFHNATAEVDQKIHLDTTNDFTFVCSDEVDVPINKEAFSKSSPIFKAIFNLIDQKQDKTKIDDIDSNTMHHIIGFVYTRGSADWSVEIATKLLHVAENYEIIKLKCDSHDFLMNKIDFSNVLEILELADFYNLKRLEGKCLTFIVT